MWFEQGSVVSLRWSVVSSRSLGSRGCTLQGGTVGDLCGWPGWDRGCLQVMAAYE